MRNCTTWQYWIIKSVAYSHSSLPRRVTIVSNASFLVGFMFSHKIPLESIMFTNLAVLFRLSWSDSKSRKMTPQNNVRYENLKGVESRVV